MKDKIIAFLNNELSAQERHEFEAALGKDPALRQEFDFQKDKYDKLKAFQLRTVAQSHAAEWANGRRKKKVIRLRITNGLAIAASSALVVFFVSIFVSTGGHKDSDSVNPPKTDTTVRITKPAIPQPQSPPTMTGAEKSPTNNRNPPKKEGALSKPVVQPLVVTPIKSDITVLETSKSDPVAGTGGGTSQKTVDTLPTQSALDSVLHLPIKMTLSETAFVERIQQSLQIQADTQIQILVKQYYHEAENITLKGNNSPIYKATFWLLKAMHNFETSGDSVSVLSCLETIPEPFFKIEKLFYQRAFDIATLKEVLPQIKPNDLLYEKKVQIILFLK
jgi:hypothetical protein